QLYFNNTDEKLYFVDNNSRISSTTLFNATSSWTHIAIVRDSSNDIKMYINGTKEGVTYPNSSPYIGAQIQIGRRYGNNSGWYQGYMDEIRISKGVARWTSGFTPPNQAHYTHFDPRQGHQTVAYTDDSSSERLFLLGGRGDSSDYNDLWYTSDGTYWYQSTFVPTYAASTYFDVLVFDDGGASGDDLYLFGGYNGSNLNQVYSWDGNTSGNFTSLTPSINFTARRFHSITKFKNQLTIVGGVSDSGSENDILMASNGFTFTQKPDFSSLEAQLISDTNKYEGIAFDLNDAQYKLFDFDDTGVGIFNLKSPAIEIKRLSRKDSSNYLAIDSNDQIIYSNSVDFLSPVTVISNSQNYKSPIFSPVSSSYIYAIKEISPSNEKIVKLAWNGVTTFGAETDLNPSFTQEDISLLSLSFSSDGKDLFFIGTIPPSASIKMYKVSTNGSGLTTFLAPNPKGSALILDGEKYNPYISDYTIQSSDILDQSIYESRIALGTITAGDFVPGGLTE
ncbi:hypothetical protein MJH12_06480, partial [bacterium]|nr:hypothetical protein [bacterium]